MVDNKTVLPVWFAVWRRLFTLVIGLFLISLLAAIPLALTSLQISADASTAQTQSVVVRNLLVLALFPAMIGAPIGLILLVLAGICNAAVGRLHRWEQRVPWRRLGLPAFVGIVVGIVLVAALAYGGPVVGKIFSSTIIGQCIFSTRIVTFVDLNSNGIRDGSEPGLAQVHGSVVLRDENSISGVWSTLPFGTDSNGLAVVGANYPCSINQYTLSVDIPQGYTATTETATEPRQLLHQIGTPNVFYAGFKTQ